VGDTFVDKLNFAGLAEYARTRGTDNPGGLFWRLLNWTKSPNGGARKPSPAWHFVTDGDEERVRLRLKEFLEDVAPGTYTAPGRAIAEEDLYGEQVDSYTAPGSWGRSL